jgi:hypothetical protein
MPKSPRDRSAVVPFGPARFLLNQGETGSPASPRLSIHHSAMS